MEGSGSKEGEEEGKEGMEGKTGGGSSSCCAAAAPSLYRLSVAPSHYGQMQLQSPPPQLASRAP